MSRLRPLLFAVCAVSAAVPAFAAWEEIERFDDGMRVYVRRDSLQREGDIGVLEHLVRWPEPQTGDDHPPYRSTVVRAAYHCAEKLERYLGSRSHAGVLGDLADRGFESAQNDLDAGIDEFIHVRANCYNILTWLQSKGGIK